METFLGVKLDSSHWIHHQHISFARMLVHVSPGMRRALHLGDHESTETEITATAPLHMLGLQPTVQLCWGP